MYDLSIKGWWKTSETHNLIVWPNIPPFVLNFQDECDAMTSEKQPEKLKQLILLLQDLFSDLNDTIVTFADGCSWSCVAKRSMRRESRTIGGDNSNIFFWFSSRNLGEMIQFDVHIFQMGWNSTTNERTSIDQTGLMGDDWSFVFWKLERSHAQCCLCTVRREPKEQMHCLCGTGKFHSAVFTSFTHSLWNLVHVVDRWMIPTRCPWASMHTWNGQWPGAHGLLKENLDLLSITKQKPRQAVTVYNSFILCFCTLFSTNHVMIGTSLVEHPWVLLNNKRHHQNERPTDSQMPHVAMHRCIGDVSLLLIFASENPFKNGILVQLN